MEMIKVEGYNEKLYPLLSEEETKKLILENTKEAKDKLFMSNLKLVFKTVYWFNNSCRNNSISIDDLFQVGSIALINAINKFDIKSDSKLSTYIVNCVVWGINNYLRDNGYINISADKKLLYSRIMKATEAYNKEHMQEPSIKELASILNVKELDIKEIYDLFTPVSLDSVLDVDDNLTMVDTLGIEEKEYSNIEINESLKNALNSLQDKERVVIYLKFFKNKTQSEIAKIINLSQVQVSRIEKKALEKLKEFM